ncbi:group II intron reverse transcriptase/maturase [uncultured Castellaniella sp.]|uniref:group II intron reverse transcriptase/maturase n=1 Tax=uncultured Castellaniella sp. TaxID=647907 RepID=UPI002605DB32|nr:group II intron reverse transcriptase/maturase [uncultured Castellaniella sp.]
MKLTAKAIELAQPADKEYLLSDGEKLYLRVHPSGKKSWQFIYLNIENKRVKLTLGTVPEVSLARARELAAGQRQNLAIGKDPRARKREERQEARRQELATFDKVAREWHTHAKAVHEWSDDYSQKILRQLELHAFPKLGRHPIGSLNQLDVLQCLEAISLAGTRETAIRLRESLQRVYARAVTLGLLKPGDNFMAKGVADFKLRSPMVKHYATILEPQKIGQLIRDIRGYRAMPLRRIYIPKSNGKKRPLGIPCMRDRAMQALWKLALEPIAETLADPNSYGFRPERSTADAIEQCFNALCKRNSAEWILEGDIRGCFDNFSHRWFLEHIPMDRSILRQWLEAGYVDEGSLFETRAGTPQGGIISPVIANMALDGLEAAVHVHPGRTDRERRKAKINIIRYADDFVVTGASKDVLESQILPAIRRFMAERGLELSEEKTRITHIAQGFDFLGQNVRKYGDLCLTMPAQKSIKSLLDKVRQIVNGNASITQETLIRLLNPVIRGWVMYHRHSVAKRAFSWIDAHIWRLLWNWAKRRHPNKGARWVKDRYFHVIGRSNWNFATKGSADGKIVVLKLFRAPAVSIIRHVKIAAAAHPFDPAWAKYLSRRRASKRSVKLPGASPWC